MKNLALLSDQELLVNLSRLNSKENEIVGEILCHLMEVDKRKLYIERGYTSLFSYCVEVLGYCDGSAGRRVAAVRCIEKFPELYEHFVKGRVSLTTISLISRIIREENREEVISEVLGKRKVEVEEYVASFLPKREVRERIRAVPTYSSASGVQMEGVREKLAKRSQGQSNEREEREQREERQVREKSTVTYEIKLKATSLTVRKLKRVQHLRKRESMGELLEVLLSEYLKHHSPEEREKRRVARRVKRKSNHPKEISLSKAILIRKPEGDQSSPRGGRTSRLEDGGSRSRYISRGVRDKIFKRDKGQCAYVSPEGKRCSCKSQLQVDHITPFAMGGTHRGENLRLLCPTHNLFSAEQVFGKRFIQEKIGAKGRR